MIIQSYQKLCRYLTDDSQIALLVEIRTKDRCLSHARKWCLSSGHLLRSDVEGLLLTLRDLTRVLLTLWTRDDLIFIHERSRIQFTLIFRMNCWTGARLSAFFTGGLRYGVSSLISLTLNAH
jgi:hypothetical protein